MASIYTIDGMPTTDPQGRWKLHKATRYRAFPGRIATGTTLPGRDGNQPSLGTPFLPGRLSLTFNIYGTTHDAMMDNLTLLYGIIGTRHKLLTITHEYAPGKTIQALAEVTGASDPSTLKLNLSRVQFDLSIPSVFWRSPATVDTTQPIPQGASNPSPFLTEFGGGTGPINDALIRFRGNFSQVILDDIVSGDRLTVNQAATSTQYVVVDTANWVARLHQTDTWDLVGGTDVINNIVSNRGSGPMFTLNPDFASGAGRYQMRITGAINATTSPVVTVRAKRSFI